MQTAQGIRTQKEISPFEQSLDAEKQQGRCTKARQPKQFFAMNSQS
jgi:hypothetical protein